MSRKKWPCRCMGWIMGVVFFMDTSTNSPRFTIRGSASGQT